jgi:hypothetical protein
MKARLRSKVSFAVLALTLTACHRMSTTSASAILGDGRWGSNEACLSVAADGCRLIVGCGHGEFPRPSLRTDGTFDVDGTYRIEAGPVSIQPAPPAHFSGVVSGNLLMLRVVPTAAGLTAASYSLTLSGAGTCPTLCL